MEMEIIEPRFVAGTSLQGTICARYDDLAFCLGDPRTEGLDNSTAEWNMQIRTDDGDYHTVTLYDWGQYTTPTKAHHWNVGAFDMDGFNALFDFLDRNGALGFDVTLGNNRLDHRIKPCLDLLESWGEK